MEIADSLHLAVAELLGGLDTEVVGLGISNQRESALVWRRSDGRPMGPVLGWQDRRTAARVREAERRGWLDVVEEKSGLPLDPMFSALKLQWLLDQVDPDRSQSRSGKLAVGTVDSWMAFVLTGEHRIEMGNASRTQLFALDVLDWDDQLLEIFNVPRACLPEVFASNVPTAPVRGLPGIRDGVRIYGALGDSHAALFAHGARTPGDVKATYGSGSSIIGLAGDRVPRASGLVRTIAWSTDVPAYAFEGTVLSTGATLLWLAQLLGTDPAGLSALAQSSEAQDHVDLIPAFAGLGAPYWDDDAVALVCGFGLGTSRAELARAAFESIALQTEMLFRCVADATGEQVGRVLVDGGPTQNDWLMQLQADLSQRTVSRSNVAELSALGAAHLAGVSSGFWTSEECITLAKDVSTFVPAMDPLVAAARRERWRSAVERSRFQPSGGGPSDAVSDPGSGDAAPAGTVAVG
ncbi:FGGY-family carbohydrate kinase [Herbiconiux moechotypicola]|uniref:ATP:glycerol 3-phosphotransferase n=2 Tax=Herbiconiux moechotypicola TaxID=637393 RepID=A0ABN3E7V0_9MICO